MSEIVKLLSQKKPFLFSGGVSEEQIHEAESKLEVKFAKEYTEYLLAFGTASYYGHELTGICDKNSSINVVDVTLEERNFFANIPKEWYVIEQTHMDGIVIWQDREGYIYKATPQKIVLIHNSLKEYVEIA